MKKQTVFHWSNEWKAKRKKILARDSYRDQWEARYGRNVNADTVHHIFPVEWFPEYKMASWNLISLSTKTHNMMHDRASGALTEAGMTLADRVARKYERWEDLDRLKRLNDFLMG
jgi:5-methylcytosine-specific restriction endonuclease McrA